MKWAWGGGWRLPAFLCQTTSSPGFCPISRAHFRDRKTLRKRVHHKGPPLNELEDASRTASFEDCRKALTSYLEDLIPTTPQDFTWAVRASAAMLCNFLLGYYGYCSTKVIAQEETGRSMYKCFIMPHTTAFASTNAALMSRFSGGSMDAAQQRVAVVALATLIG